MTFDAATLLSPGTAKLRDRVRELPAVVGPRDVAAVSAAFPRLDPDLVRGAVTQEMLRRRARGRFGALADDMLCTRDGLEQASRPVVAARRAARLVDLGFDRFADLGCGIGVDSMAAARAGLAVLAVEEDPETSRIAAVNIRRQAHLAWQAEAPDRPANPPRPTVTVETRDATQTPPPRDAAVFVDPARGSGHRADGSRVRTVAPESWRPAWPWVVDLAAAHSAVVAKAAPGIPHRAIPGSAATEWVSVAGDLVETTVWFGNLAHGLARRTAVLVTPGPGPWSAQAEHRLASDEPEVAAPDGPLGAWVLEPDPAVIRSHLVRELCDVVGGHLVGPALAYVTTAQDPGGEFGRRDRILDVLPADARKLRAELRHRGVGSVEIRTRGLNLDPQRYRRELRLSGGSTQAHLVVTRVQGKAAALLVEPAAAARERSR